ncbi:MAG: DotD/TraH family lipoprotein [Alphaproteobacteria bacterium]|nr:DotD/TraH family lipoprotein [Alphaproteobacteria bacterium]
MPKSKYAFLLALAMLLAACAQETTLTPVVAENDPVTVRLAKAAEKAANALDDIAAVESNRSPAVVVQDFSGAPDNLQQPTTITWHGPVEQIVETLASRAGYRFNLAGKAPPVPVVVTLNVFEKPLIKVLQDIGMQLGQRADLAVDAERGLVEVQYAAAHPKG